ncbi:MAG: family 20 glycosylhydrolase, partial [Lentisphaeria bacterium]|nr:family 20 glycosylhydrolase [Lentisphaeria bacterium]
MDDRETKILTERLIPIPLSVAFADGETFQLRDGCRIQLRAADLGGARELAETCCRRYWDIRAEVAAEPAPETAELPADAYSLQVAAAQVTVTARGVTGIRNAFRTLRQLAEVRRGTERTAGHFLVPCRIDDAPALEFRGIHLCIFPETPLWDIEKQLRLAAYHKFNYAVIECWGVFPFESHPEMRWRDRSVDRDELKRLIELARDLGITPIPQLNVFGHASAARVITGKHFVLDFDPALQPLFEPSGWSWCLSNPETRRILTDMARELHDFFGRPPYFHIGCDEA